MIIRPIALSDMSQLLAMLQTSGQFDDEGLQHVQEKLNSYFAGSSEELWFSAEQQGLAGVAYCAPEVMTNGVWNLLMLWINPIYQRQGIGHALLSQVEKKLINKQARLLLVETSSADDFMAARAFYSQQGFIKEAQIRNYYALSEDKLIYTKTISS